jgi:L-ascorbate metabolism protein UlaG (beta-lactamase superfamily)
MHFSRGIILCGLHSLALMLVTTLLAKTAMAACLLGMVDRAPHTQFAMSMSPDRPALLAQMVVVPKGKVSVTYIGHSSFLIETPGGASAVTDYNGVHTPPFAPNIVTMNFSHETHYTDVIQDGVLHVLRGWKPGGGLARHDIRHRDLRVFNLPTNIGEFGDAGTNNNSIFVFEISNLCIAHLGHLHHVLTREQLRDLGRIDVLFVPIDGSSTLSHEQAVAVIQQISPRLIIPMHFGFMGAADLFFEQAKKYWAIKSETGSKLLISRDSLPRSTEVRFLQGGGTF